MATNWNAETTEPDVKLEAFEAMMDEIFDSWETERVRAGNFATTVEEENVPPEASFSPYSQITILDSMAQAYAWKHKEDSKKAGELFFSNPFQH